MHYKINRYSYLHDRYTSDTLILKVLQALEELVKILQQQDPTILYLRKCKSKTMQIQNLHVPLGERLTSRQQFMHLVKDEGLTSVYRGLTPELLKVIPMVGTMFVVYEWSKELLNVKHNR